MAKDKIEVKRIENNSARKVSFAKRRKGLFKKGEELSILCDAEVALFVVSETGKPFSYASSSMEKIIQRHNLSSTKTTGKQQKSSQEQQVSQDTNYSGLNGEVAERSREIWKRNAEEIQGLSLEELESLHKRLETGLKLVKEKKEAKLMKEINELKEKEMQLMKCNELLRKEVEETSDWENAVSEEA